MSDLRNLLNGLGEIINLDAPKPIPFRKRNGIG